MQESCLSKTEEGSTQEACLDGVRSQYLEKELPETKSEFIKYLAFLSDS